MTTIRLPLRAAALILLLWTAPQAFPRQHVPSPSVVLGYDLGSRFTSAAGITAYLHALADSAPDRMKIIRYGSTYEGRELSLAVVSSPENLSRLDRIRADSRRLADPRSMTDAEADALIQKMPAIAWLSYGVHGNEASSPEAALNVLHTLLSARDTGTAELLKNVVVVIDPLLNPDGHERYVNFQVTRSGATPNEDPAAVEHNEDWPSGRTNHYLFDLNRDWTWLTQAESRARVKAYQEWMPHVHVDFHEMGYNSSYFFFPAFKPINANFPPSTVEWGEIYGRGNAEAFDREGWTYYSGESFDLFYPGYGDSWPSLHGAIGMTYEQAGQTGVRVRRRDEAILTLKDRLDHHSAASLATLRTTATHREKRLKDFRKFFADAISEGRTGPVRSFIIPPGDDPARTAKMIDLLIAQGVEVVRAGAAFSAGDAKTYFPSVARPGSFPAGSYIIRLDQPAKRLVMALMEREPVVTDTSFYDISAWCLPIAFGVETWWSSSVPAARATPVLSAPLPGGNLEGAHARYAYVIPWTSNNSIRALVRLFRADYKTHVAMREFTLGGRKYGRGTIIVPVKPNPAGIDSAMESLAREFHLEIAGTNSGFTESGMNLGSNRAVLLKRPKIAVVTGDPVGTTAFGSIWSMFDTDYGMDFVPVTAGRLARTDLGSYTAIVFPDDNSGGRGYSSALDSGFTKKLKTWIASGGTFVGIDGGAVYATRNRAGISDVTLKEKRKKKEGKSDDKKVDEPDEPDQEELEKLLTVEEREQKRRREEVPGTIVSVKLDNSHPLGFGYDTTIAVFRSSSRVFELSASGYNVGVYRKSPRVSGLMSPENEKMLAGTPFLVHETVGSGNVVLFADDPNFRLFWDSLNRVFMNSLLLMPSIRSVEMAASQQND
jgi:hypothetical protein